jgi:hypothetical protein
MCEGDDFWTDPLKLQKQVDFLESKPEYIMSFHSALLHFENGTPDRIFAELENREYTGYELFDKWLAQTSSWVFRNTIKLPDYFVKISLGDIVLLLTIAEYGKIFCINETMGVYRRHSNQITNFYPKSMHLNLIRQYEIMSKYYNHKYDPIIKRKILEHAANIIYAPDVTSGEVLYTLFKMAKWSPKVVFSKFFLSHIYMFAIKAKVKALRNKIIS